MSTAQPVFSGTAAGQLPLRRMTLVSFEESRKKKSSFNGRRRLRNKPPGDWPRIFDNLQNGRLKVTGKRVANYAYQTLYGSIFASVEELRTEDKFRFENAPAAMQNYE
jgi:hypothetical protein